MLSLKISHEIQLMQESDLCKSCVDNQGCMSVAHNGNLNEQTKHDDVKL